MNLKWELKGEKKSPIPVRSFLSDESQMRIESYHYGIKLITLDKNGDESQMRIES